MRNLYALNLFSVHLVLPLVESESGVRGRTRIFVVVLSILTFI